MPLQMTVERFAGQSQWCVEVVAVDWLFSDSHLLLYPTSQYRDGFVVDDGPYRRLDDPANADFLRALAMGRTPRELMEDSESGNVVVGLVDKRGEEYVEQFRSFSGQGNSLGTAAAPAQLNAVFEPSVLPASPPAVDDSQPSTSIQVRLLNGQRRVIKVNLSQTVADLAAQLREDANSQPFRLVSGFPPKPLENPGETVEAAGLKGAQVSMQKSG